MHLFDRTILTQMIFCTKQGGSTHKGKHELPAIKTCTPRIECIFPSTPELDYVLLHWDMYSVGRSIILRKKLHHAAELLRCILVT